MEPRRTDHFHDDSSFVELLDNTSLVDNAWVDDIVQLQQDLSVSQVAVETVDSRRHSQAVHPVTIR